MEIALSRRIVPAHKRKAFGPIDVEALARHTHCLPPAFELIPRLLVLRDEAFLADHTEIGGPVLRDWKFPDRIVAAVFRHHAPLTPTRELINLEKHNLLIYEEEMTEMIHREEERLC